MTDFEASYRANEMLSQLADIVSARLLNTETDASEKEYLEYLSKWMVLNLPMTSLLLGIAAGAMHPDSAMRRGLFE